MNYPKPVVLTGCLCGDLSCTVPFGKCHCGCGADTPISSRTYKAGRRVTGLPCRYLRNHDKRMPPVIENAVPFKMDGFYCRLIPLGRGLYAIVNATDYGWLMQWRWNAHGYRRGGFYAQRTEYYEGRQRVVFMHRQILGLKHGDPRMGDHIVPNTLDNRRANLRIATSSQNLQNRAKMSNNTSGYKGVSWHKRDKVWRASICIDGQQEEVGRFPSAELAYQAYCDAARRLHGEFARIA